jgi:hypothetical protein
VAGGEEGEGAAAGIEVSLHSFNVMRSFAGSLEVRCDSSKCTVIEIDKVAETS